VRYSRKLPVQQKKKVHSAIQVLREMKCASWKRIFPASGDHISGERSDVSRPISRAVAAMNLPRKNRRTDVLPLAGAWYKTLHTLPREFEAGQIHVNSLSKLA